MYETKRKDADAKLKAMSEEEFKALRQEAIDALEGSLRHNEKIIRGTMRNMLV